MYTRDINLLASLPPFPFILSPSPPFYSFQTLLPRSAPAPATSSHCYSLSSLRPREFLMTEKIPGTKDSTLGEGARVDLRIFTSAATPSPSRENGRSRSSNPHFRSIYYGTPIPFRSKVFGNFMMLSPPTLPKNLDVKMKCVEVANNSTSSSSSSSLSLSLSCSGTLPPSLLPHSFHSPIYPSHSRPRPRRRKSGEESSRVKKWKVFPPYFLPCSGFFLVQVPVYPPLPEGTLGSGI